MAFGVYSPVVNVELKVTTARVYSIELQGKESLRLVKKWNFRGRLPNFFSAREVSFVET